jgi:hypothetical protein
MKNLAAAMFSGNSNRSHGEEAIELEEEKRGLLQDWNILAFLCMKGSEQKTPRVNFQVP